jgi:hypothetical protein
MDRLPETGGLLDERAHEVLGHNLRKAADVEDVLLRVKGGELATPLG